MRVAVDWDGTLVDDRQEWLPGALDALRRLVRAGYTVIVFSCRAGWPEGLQEIRGKLEADRLQRWVFVAEGAVKPSADVYVDDRAVRFEGDWAATLDVIDACGRS